MSLFLFSFPWLLVGLYMVLFFRNPKSVPVSDGLEGEGVPFVSVIVPARNEEANIGRCVASLCAMEYPAFEVLVVDDGSEDGTAAIVESLSPGGAASLRLLKGRPLPDGWFGKPWACWQGASAARGELLLFTDADTVHSPALLGQTVGELLRERADVCTLIGRQIMGSFWEQLLQPQFFMLLAARYPRAGTSRKPSHWRHAIANGQYLLFRRQVYEASGGHRAVAGEVVEDLRLAQLLVRGGWKLMVRGAEGLQTRMYRSLGGLVEGWAKNVATAALQTTAPWLLPFILPLSLVAGVTIWLVPPLGLAWALVTGTGGILLAWALSTTGLSVLIWSRASGLMGGNPLFGFLYPLGSLMAQYIVLTSWRRGANIRWKGREYGTPQGVPAETPSEPGPAWTAE